MRLVNVLENNSRDSTKDSIFTKLLLFTLAAMWLFIIPFSVYACIDLSYAAGGNLGSYLACILNTGGPFAAAWLFCTCWLLLLWRLI